RRSSFDCPKIGSPSAKAVSARFSVDLHESNPGKLILEDLTGLNLSYALRYNGGHILILKITRFSEGHFMKPKDDNSNKGETFHVSRRDFLKSASVGGLVTAVTATAEMEAQTPGPRVVGPGEVPVQLNVNGKRIDLRIAPRVTLLDVLRMRTDLTGNKRGCDRGAC